MPSQNGIEGLRNQIETGKRKSRFSIFYRKYAEQTSTKVNVPIVKAYQSSLRVYADADETELMKMAVRMPDTMKIERDEIDENDWYKSNRYRRSVAKHLEL
jgi:hypothetical protein